MRRRNGSNPEEIRRTGDQKLKAEGQKDRMVGARNCNVREQTEAECEYRMSTNQPGKKNKEIQ
jgi:hypothetical protein